MNAISRSFSAVGILALAATLVAAAPGLANAGHKISPPGWNTPTKPTGQIIHQRTAPAAPANSHLCTLHPGGGPNFLSYTC